MPRLPTLIQRRFEAWLTARHRRTDTQQLSHRNVYILPTKAGLMFGITLAILLLTSINYQLNLGYALTFLLLGSALVSMHMTHYTLHGLSLHLRPVAPTFANRTAQLEVVIQGPTGQTRNRYSIGLRLCAAPISDILWINLPAGHAPEVTLGFIPKNRGHQPIPSWTIETRFPFGLFRAWSLWRPASEVLVYPQPEHPAPPLPSSQSVQSSLGAGPPHGRGEWDGVRSYRRGDPLKTIVWKKAAQAMASGSELVSRDRPPAAPAELWLDWQMCTGLDTEARLSRLCAWVNDAHRADLLFGLLMPHSQPLPMGSGDSHRQAALRVLALWS